LKFKKKSCLFYFLFCIILILYHDLFCLQLEQLIYFFLNKTETNI